MGWNFKSVGKAWTLTQYGIFHQDQLYATVDIDDFEPGGVWFPWQQAYLFCRDLVRKLNNLDPLPPMLDRSKILTYEGKPK